MPKEKTGAPAAAEQPDFVHMTVPKGFAHPYSLPTRTARSGTKPSSTSRREQKQTVLILRATAWTLS